MPCLFLALDLCGLSIPIFVDVDDVKFVINYDYPMQDEDYIHRCTLPHIDS